MRSFLIAAVLIVFRTAVAQASGFVIKCGDGDCTVFRAELALNDLQLLATDEMGMRLGNARAVETWAHRHGKKLLFATNAGIFDPSFKPLGLFISQGKELMPLNRERGEGNFYLQPNGVFYVSHHIGRIVETSHFVPQTEISVASQSGPLLLEHGVISAAFQPDSLNKVVRSGVGVRGDHQVFFAISNGPINFYDFARLFKDGLHCDSALYLDGEISKMYLPELRRFERGGDFAALFAVVQ